MKAILTFLACVFASALFSQSNINQTLSVNGTGALADPSAQLDVSATDKGVLVPRMTTAQRTAIASPATGLLVFDTDAGSFWYKTAGGWVNLLPGGNAAWSLTGNNALATDFLGTTNNQPLVFKVNNLPAGKITATGNNTFFGLSAGQANTSGYSNIAIGKDALRSNMLGSNLVAVGDSALYNNLGVPDENWYGLFNTAIGSKALFSNTRGSLNTAIGLNAQFYNISGSENTAIGTIALFHNTIGSGNTAVGMQALYDNTAGYSNTAHGAYALRRNITGNKNVANGVFSMEFNITGSENTAVGFSALGNSAAAWFNTAIGFQSLGNNSIGEFNTAVGHQALRLNNTGANNTAIGQGALQMNTTGGSNTALGKVALQQNTTGYENTANGNAALFSNTSGFSNTASGLDALHGNTTGDNNAALGFVAGNDGGDNDLCVAIGSQSDVGTISTSYDNAIAIGYDCNTTANNYARIGNTSVGSIGGQVGWSTYSDGRFKRNVQEDVAGLDFISRLRPITYQWDIHALNDFVPTTNDTIEWTGKYDIEQVRFTGFIAQEVEQAAKAESFDFSGVDRPQNETTPYALRYSEFVVPLVKGMQEQQAIIEAQKEKIDFLHSQLDKIAAALAGAGIVVEK